MTTVKDAPVAWRLCPSCREMLYQPRLERNLMVCPLCGHHDRLNALERINQLLDPGYELLNGLSTTDAEEVPDPLGFVDTQPYPERVRRARHQTGLDEAVVCARGAIEGHPVITAVMDFRFLGGSLGAAVGQRITAAAKLALQQRTPLMLVTASGGARMQEGIISLMQMATTSQALAQLDEAGILTIGIITDPTYGGVAASYATLCDILIAEPGARLGFAGPRVIQQTIRQKLPENFQSAESLKERGFIDAICPRGALRSTLARLLKVTSRQARPLEPTPGSLITDPGQLAERDPWQTVQQARDLRRPTTADYIAALCTDFTELTGDRATGDCTAIIGGLALFRGRPAMIIGHQKGHTPAELQQHNFGMPTPAGYRKAARLMRLAAKLGLPIITLVDTPGAYPGVTAEEQGQAFAIAENLRLMATLPVPIVTVITGEGGSGGALALAVANTVLAHTDAIYSVISPEGCAAILWKDPAATPTAAQALRLQTRDLLTLQIIDGVIAEPDGGVPANPTQAIARLGDAVSQALDQLSTLPPNEIIAQRHQRFTRYTLTQHQATGGLHGPFGQEAS